jgi:hypothetical protein
MFVVQSLNSEIAADAARRLAAGDPFVEEVEVDAPVGYPCRVTLEWAKPGERVLLFKHRPFSAPSPYAEEGPVFARMDAPAKVLPIDTLPDYVAIMPLVIVRAYDQRNAIACAEAVPGAACAEAIGKAFAREDVAYVHIRAGAYGCFQFRVDRA